MIDQIRRIITDPYLADKAAPIMELFADKVRGIEVENPHDANVLDCGKHQQEADTPELKETWQRIKAVCWVDRMKWHDGSESFRDLLLKELESKGGE